MPWYMCRGQRTILGTWLHFSTFMCFLGIRFRSPGLYNKSFYAMGQLVCSPQWCLGLEQSYNKRGSCPVANNQLFGGCPTGLCHTPLCPRPLTILRDSEEYLIHHFSPDSTDPVRSTQRSLPLTPCLWKEFREKRQEALGTSSTWDNANPQ